MAEFAPAPWTVIDEYGKNNGNPTISGWINGADGKPVVEYMDCGTHSAEWRSMADRALALAAPELYAALTELSAWYVTHLLASGATQFDVDTDGALCEAKAALRRAQGETPR